MITDRMPHCGIWEISDSSCADVAALVALDERNFPPGEEFDEQLWQSIVGERARQGEMLTLVARHQGAVVGAIVGEFQRSTEHLMVWSIAVDEAHRGSGLAEHLLAGLVRGAPPACRVVVLDTRRDNARARRFYERLGFRQVGEIPGVYAGRVDAIRYASSVTDLDRVLTGGTE